MKHTVDQLNLFAVNRERLSIATTPTINGLLAANSPVAIGVSGGKDSVAAAYATVSHLNSIGHTGPRLLIHADLGSTEWPDSLPVCQRLAKRLNLELVVVKRKKGDMLQRWQQRWNDNLIRYARLECVKLILPWSTAKMRFCTSEMKTQVICRELAKRYPGQTIINVTGVRREESDERKNKPIESVNKYLIKEKKGTYGYDWQPLVHWSLSEVWQCLNENNLPIHEAYTRYGSSRVSCMFCMLGKKADHQAAASCADSHPLLRAQVDLEIESTFHFQDRWLGDLKPELLTLEQIQGIAIAKQKAVQREAAEATIPKHLHYKKGWPESIPTAEEARLIADIRRLVAQTVGFQIGYTTPETVQRRYAELIDLKTFKTPKKSKSKKLKPVLL